MSFANSITKQLKKTIIVDTETITKIIDLMTTSDLTEFDIEQEGLKLRIKRGNSAPYISHSIESHPRKENSLGNQAPDAQAEDTSSSFELIKSPIVGTFYHAPSPDSPIFVKAGDSVQPNTTVCIIEAMKVMNEIHAEASGTIVEVLVKNGQTVEYGQPLFKVQPC